MKTYITLRSTLSNVSWNQRGAVALLVAIIFALTLALRPSPQAPASTPALRKATPAARNPNTPVMGTGSAYDGGTYAEYLTPRMPLDSSSSVAPNVNLPVMGTGSAYDGQ
jgi:hypothetical protein